MTLFSIGIANRSSPQKAYRRNRNNASSVSALKVSSIRQRRSPWRSMSVCTCGRTVSNSKQSKVSSHASGKKLQEEKKTDNVSNYKLDTEAQYSWNSLLEVPFEVIEAEDILLWGCPPPKIPRLNFEEGSKELFDLVLTENTALVPAYCKGRKFLKSTLQLPEYTTPKSWTAPSSQVVQNKSYSVADFDSPAVIKWQDWSTLDACENPKEPFVDVRTFGFGSQSESRSSTCEVYDVTDDTKPLPLSKRPTSSQLQFSFCHSPLIEDISSDIHDIIEGTAEIGLESEIEQLGIPEATVSAFDQNQYLAPETTSSAGTHELVENDIFLTKIPALDSFIDENENFTDQTKPLSGNSASIFKQHGECNYQEDTVNIHLFHSLPVIYANVFDIDDDQCEFCKSKSKERLESRRRRANSIGIISNENFSKGASFQVLGDDCVTPSASQICLIEEADDDEGNKELLEVYKSVPLNSSSSKVPFKSQSAVPSTDRPQSAPSAAVSFISFSPPDSFATKLEETTTGLGDLSFVKSADFVCSKAEPLSQENVLCGGEIERGKSASTVSHEHNAKFYPPPTPIKSMKKCTSGEEVESKEAKGNETRKKSDGVICNQVLLNANSFTHTKRLQNDLVLSQDKVNKNYLYESKDTLPSGGMVVDCQPSRRVGISPEFQIIHKGKTMLKWGIAVPSSGMITQTSASSMQPPRSPNASVKSSSDDKTSTDSPNANDQQSSDDMKTARKRRVRHGSRKTRRKLRSKTNRKKHEARKCSSEKTLMSSDVNKNESKSHRSKSSSALEDKSKSYIPETSSSSPTSESSFKLKVPKKSLKKNRVHRKLGGKRDKKIKLNPGSNDRVCVRRRPRNSRKQGGQDSNAEDAGKFDGRQLMQSERRETVESDLSGNVSQSSESTNYKTRKKGRRKQTLWQKMIQYFFGCSARRKSYDNLAESPRADFYGSDYKPSISLFERIIIWWRRKTHRQVVVRQDSLEMFRIQRRKWMREIHEFYEDCRVVSKNVREVEQRKPPHTTFQLPKARVINSDGCVQLRNQLENLDRNANKTENSQSTKSRRPTKGILKYPKPSIPQKQFKKSTKS